MRTRCNEESSSSRTFHTVEVVGVSAHGENVTKCSLYVVVYATGLLLYCFAQQRSCEHLLFAQFSRKQLFCFVLRPFIVFNLLLLTRVNLGVFFVLLMFRYCTYVVFIDHISFR